MQITLILGLLVSFVSSQNLTFTNPIIGGYSETPCILRVGDFYYLTLRDPSYMELIVHKSLTLTNFRNVESKVIFRAPEGFYGLAPNEMVEVNGELYIYFHMRSQVDSRLFVIKANNPSDPMEGWGEPTRLLQDWDYAVVHGAVMKHDGQLYFVWSSNLQNHSLFIAHMTSPTLVGSPKVLIREPLLDWECHGLCICEAAAFIYRSNMTYLVYSASDWKSPNSSLSYMSIPHRVDPLSPYHWHVTQEPVFWGNDDEDVYSTGQAEFTVSPDGSEIWMVYHATVHIDGRHTTRLEKIEWNEDGSPKFPRPSGIDDLKRVPSGQFSTCA